MDGVMSDQTKRLLISYQRMEQTDHEIYARMVAREKNPENKRILLRIAADERKHVDIWRSYTGQEVGPSRLRVFWYSLLSRLMGYTFVIKLLEKGEYTAGKAYEALIAEIPEAQEIIGDEQRHEEELASMLDEERLQYIGAMVLGLNDALVELTGAMAGLTLALMNTQIVALSGIITGVSATLSMAASNYLAERAEGNKNALKSSFYTGAAYLVTVVLLVLPYLLYPSQLYLAALMTMLGVVVLVILFFNYYIAVAKSQPFWRRFLEMACISLGVAVIAFGIGLLAKMWLGVDL